MSPAAKEFERLVTFSPLIIGEWTATLATFPAGQPGPVAFSPLIIGEWTATLDRYLEHAEEFLFQSPNHRGVDCNGAPGRGRRGCAAPLSVP